MQILPRPSVVFPSAPLWRARIWRRRVANWWASLPEFLRALLTAIPIAVFAWLWIVLLLIAGL